MINRFNNIFHTTSYYNELEFKVINNLPQTFDYFISDQSKIFSIYTNLIDNAIKFTPAGFIKVHIENDSENIIFSINDTGVGIPHAKIHSIFENFSQIDVSETRKYEGSGLGLSIAKGYIELLGGKIWVESEEGKGSTFSFSVPII